MDRFIRNVKVIVILVGIFVLINSCKKEHQVKLRIQNNFGVDIEDVEAGGAFFGNIQYGATSEYKIILSGEDRVLRFLVPNVKEYSTVFYINSRGKIKMQINPIGEDITFVKE